MIPDAAQPTLTDLRIIRAACFDQIRAMTKKGFMSQATILEAANDKLNKYIKQLEAENG